jgi:hypothetical protein
MDCYARRLSHAVPPRGRDPVSLNHVIPSHLRRQQFFGFAVFVPIFRGEPTWHPTARLAPGWSDAGHHALKQPERLTARSHIRDRRSRAC